jgi:transcriptional regulator with XRE-family HTH domain
MGRSRRTRAAVEAELQVAADAAALGSELRSSRRRRRMTQVALAQRVGLRQARISELERGEGANAPLRVWASLASAVGRRLTVQLARDALEEPVDAGHLQVQALIARLARANGRKVELETATRPYSPAHAIDVTIRDDRHRVLIAVEVWNRLDDIGAAIRSTTRKVAELEALAIAIGHGRSYRVASCWVMRRTERNVRTVARYPEIFDTRFPGSSRGWVRSLTRGDPPPMAPGLVWSDAGARRISEWRR